MFHSKYLLKGVLLAQGVLKISILIIQNKTGYDKLPRYLSNVGPAITPFHPLHESSIITDSSQG